MAPIVRPSPEVSVKTVEEPTSSARPVSSLNGAERIAAAFQGIPLHPDTVDIALDPVAARIWKHHVVAMRVHGDIYVGAIENWPQQGPLAQLLQQAANTPDGYTVASFSKNVLGPMAHQVGPTLSNVPGEKALDMDFPQSGLKFPLVTVTNRAERVRMAGLFKSLVDFTINTTGVLPVPGSQSRVVTTPSAIAKSPSLTTHGSAETAAVRFAQGRLGRVGLAQVEAMPRGFEQRGTPPRQAGFSSEGFLLLLAFVSRRIGNAVSWVKSGLSRLDQHLGGDGPPFSEPLYGPTAQRKPAPALSVVTLTIEPAPSSTAAPSAPASPAGDGAKGLKLRPDLAATATHEGPLEPTLVSEVAIDASVRRPGPSADAGAPPPLPPPRPAAPTTFAPVRIERRPAANRTDVPHLVLTGHLDPQRDVKTDAHGTVTVSLPRGVCSFVIGRTEQPELPTVVIPGNNSVSRRHVRVEVEEGGSIVIEDLGASNRALLFTKGTPIVLDSPKRVVFPEMLELQLGTARVKLVAYGSNSEESPPLPRHVLNLQDPIPRAPVTLAAIAASAQLPATQRRPPTDARKEAATPSEVMEALQKALPYAGAKRPEPSVEAMEDLKVATVTQGSNHLRLTLPPEATPEVVTLLAKRFAHLVDPAKLPGTPLIKLDVKVVSKDVFDNHCAVLGITGDAKSRALNGGIVSLSSEGPADKVVTTSIVKADANGVLNNLTLADVQASAQRPVVIIISLGTTNPGDTAGLKLKLAESVKRVRDAVASLSPRRSDGFPEDRMVMAVFGSFL